METSDICSSSEIERRITDMVIEAFAIRNLELKENLRPRMGQSNEEQGSSRKTRSGQNILSSFHDTDNEYPPVGE